MDMTISDILRNYGFPSFVLTLIVLGIWKVGKWLAPRLDMWGNRLINAHVDFIASATQIGQDNARTLEKMESAQSTQTQCLIRIDQTLEAVRKQQVAMHAQNNVDKPGVVA